MLGYSNRKAGNVTEAFTDYDKALKLKPNFAEAREYYGEAYLQDGDLPRALLQYIALKKLNEKLAQELLEKLGAYASLKAP
jgi:tetratricopeptide (TPR) repeat protein